MKFISIALITSQAFGLRRMFEDLEEKREPTIESYCDNKLVFALAEKKHILPLSTTSFTRNAVWEKYYFEVLRIKRAGGKHLYQKSAKGEILVAKRAMYIVEIEH